MERDDKRLQKVIEKFRRGETIVEEGDRSAEVLAILLTCQLSELALELALFAIERFGLSVVYSFENILSQIG